MTSNREKAIRLIAELDDFASDLRESDPAAAKEVKKAVYAVMSARDELGLAVGELMQTAAHQQGAIGPVTYEVL